MCRQLVETIDEMVGFSAYLRVVSCGKPSSDLLLDVFRVGAVPVHMATLSTERKAIVRQVNERWDPLEHGFLVHVLKKMVAIQTARE